MLCIITRNELFKSDSQYGQVTVTDTSSRRRSQMALEMDNFMKFCRLKISLKIFN